jgi:hypothetical protein
MNLTVDQTKKALKSQLFNRAGIARKLWPHLKPKTANNLMILKLKEIGFHRITDKDAEQISNLINNLENE